MVTAQQMDGIRKAIAKLDKETQRVALEIVERVGVEDAEKLRKALMDGLAPVCRVSWETAARIAQSVYNAWRLAEIGETLEAAAVEYVGEGKTAAAVNTAVKRIAEGGTVADALNVLNGRIGYDNRHAFTQGLRSMANSDPRKPRFARVPSGGETCGFCMMLASRGFVYWSGEEGTRAHNHANCDCVYVASWSKSPAAEGYDPDEWYDRWKASQEKADN